MNLLNQKYSVVYFEFFFLNEALGSSLKEHGISFQSFAPILEKAFYLYFKSWSFYVKIVWGRGASVVRVDAGRMCE